MYGVFCKMVNFGPINPKFGTVSGVLGKYGSDWAIALTLWPCCGSIINTWDFLRFQVSEIRLDTQYISHLIADYHAIC